VVLRTCSARAESLPRRTYTGTIDEDICDNGVIVASKVTPAKSNPVLMKTERPWVGKELALDQPTLTSHCKVQISW
jgi:hypothetical protein